jgi:hypothetical protein
MIKIESVDDCVLWRLTEREVEMYSTPARPYTTSQILIFHKSQKRFEATSILATVDDVEAAYDYVKNIANYNSMADKILPPPAPEPIAQPIAPMPEAPSTQQSGQPAQADLNQMANLIVENEKLKVDNQQLLTEMSGMQTKLEELKLFCVQLSRADTEESQEAQRADGTNLDKLELQIEQLKAESQKSQLVAAQYATENVAWQVDFTKEKAARENAERRIKVLETTNQKLAEDFNNLKAAGAGTKVLMKSGHVVTIYQEFPNASPDTAMDIIGRIIRRWGKYVFIIVLAIAVYLVWSLLATLEANGIDVNFYYQEVLKGTADWFLHFLPAGCR